MPPSSHPTPCTARPARSPRRSRTPSAPGTGPEGAGARPGRHRSPAAPSATRPAKHYLRAPNPIELSLPTRDDAALADLLASAVAADPSGTTQAALHHAAATLGTDLATQAATPPTPKGDPAQVPATLRQVLASRGYEPSNDTDGTIRLRNCPFDRITTHHRQLVCGPNHAILQALTDHLGGPPPPTPPATHNPHAAAAS
ncbi:MAG: hypothetical protein ACJ745_07735, partial [Actinomycetes bacterium]